MISVERVYNKLEKQAEFTSAVELAAILEANTSEVRQRLNELGKRVTSNEQDEWRVVDNVVQRLELSSLSTSEIEERDELENKVQQAFLVAGQALKILRDKRLYRQTHTSFVSYVKDRFDFTRRAADYLISASEVFDNLKREQIVLGINVLPTKESQCRELAKLTREQQSSGWITAVERAGNKVPPARIIKQVVQEIKGDPEMINPKHKKDGPVLIPGIGVEYIAVLDEETHSLLKEYMQRVGKATFNGAIRQLLDEEKQRKDPV